MSTYQISCTVGTTNPTSKLGLEIWNDDQMLINIDHVDRTQQLAFDIEEDEAEHELRFVMKNKTSDDTIVDANGNIVSDACLTIDNISFDEINLGQVFIDQAVYTHNFNGSKPETNDKFYGQMGCNGSITLKYSTPVYLWLLEHL